MRISFNENDVKKLRAKCYVLGYFNLFAAFVNLWGQFLFTAVVTYGFQCDVTVDSLRQISWSWLEPFFVFINLGSHGFFPFPITSENEAPRRMINFKSVKSEAHCYPGMLHVGCDQVLNFIINMIWMKLVMNFMAGMHQRNPERMRMFFRIGCMKLILQVLFCGYTIKFDSQFLTTNFWIIKVIDLWIAGYFLILINVYMQVLKTKKITRHVDSPPSYNEVTINSSSPGSNLFVKKEPEVVLSVTAGAPETKPSVADPDTKVDISKYNV